MRTLGLSSLGALTLAIAVACGSSSDDSSKHANAGGTGGSSDSGTGGSGGTGGVVTTPGSLQIVRDSRGIPHIYGENLQAAMYGLGYAQAEDRLWQMDFSRRFMQGRLAEWFGRGTGDGVLNKDKYQRVLGFHAFAKKVADQLPPDIRGLLDAYAQGVNDYVARSEFTLPPAFAEVGETEFEPWTVADSLVVWDRLSQIFNNDGAADELAQLTQCRSAKGCDPNPQCPAVIDEFTAQVPDTTLASVTPVEFGRPEIFMKASHAWVVSGAHTTTGLPVLHSDPQTAVRAPSVWHEFHISAGDVSARGIGVAGAPAFLVFWSKYVSQGLTAAGGDLGDLYTLEAGSAPNTYVLDGQELAYEETTENIQVKGEADVPVTRKLTKLGPVVTSVLTAVPPGSEYALRHVNLWKENDHSLVGAIGMFQAKNLEEYRAALEHWYAPGANALYAGADGHIAYHTALAIPKRAPQEQYPGWHGRVPYDGSNSANDWGDVLTADERPHNIDPSEGYLLSGNHLVVGNWFPHYTGTSGGGDTDRSFRLRYLLASKLRSGTKKPWDPVDPDAKLTPDDVLAIHGDSGSDVVRITRDALSALEQAGALATSPQAQQTLNALTAWKDSFTETDGVTPLAAFLAGTMPGKFRAGTPEVPLYPELACMYGGSYGGLTHMLRDIDKGDLDPNADAQVKKYLIDMAVLAWQTKGKSGDPSTWAPQPVPFQLLYQGNFYCKKDASATACALSAAGTTEVVLDVNFGGTILSQQGNSYSQSVNFAEIETSKAILAPGINENPSSPLFLNMLDKWKSGGVYVSPMDKALVMDGALGTTDLEFGAP